MGTGKVSGAYMLVVEEDTYHINCKVRSTWCQGAINALEFPEKGEHMEGNQGEPFCRE